LCELGFK